MEVSERVNILINGVNSDGLRLWAMCNLRPAGPILGLGPLPVCPCWSMVDLAECCAKVGERNGAYCKWYLKLGMMELNESGKLN